MDSFDMNTSSRGMQRPNFDDDDDEVFQTTSSMDLAPVAKVGSPKESPPNKGEFPSTRSMDSQGDTHMQMFQPKPMMTLDDDAPPLADLGEGDLPPGTAVWVGNTEDVKRVLGIYWCRDMEPLTSWRVEVTTLTRASSLRASQTSSCGGAPTAVSTSTSTPRRAQSGASVCAPSPPTSPCWRTGAILLQK